jgi:hypothetical protein
MNHFIGIVLLIAGGFLLVKGFNRQESIVGAASKVGTSMTAAVDGDGRQPRHIMMMVGGGLLFIAGAALTFRRNAV